VVLGSPTGEQNPWANTFSWTGVAEATYYLVEVTKPDGTLILWQWFTNVEACSGLVCQASPESTMFLPIGDYRWRIQDYGAYGLGQWTGYMNIDH
jgi:hypothetical protein